MAKPEGGRFDEDTYARARAWMAKQGEKKAEAPKPAPKPAPKKSEPVQAAKGSGRGSSAGPTADELSMYADKRKAQGRGAASGATAANLKEMRDKNFERSMVTAGANEREMNKYKDRAISAGTTAAMLAAPMLGSALRGGSAAKKTADSTAALREMTKGGPKVARKVMPSRPTAPVGKKNPMPAAQRRAEEGFSPSEANRMLARKQAAAKATKPSAPPPKPKASASKTKPSPRARTRYNQDEAKVEFRKGGMTKKGCK